MSEIIPGFTFGSTEQVTNSKLASLVNQATIDPSVITDKPVDSTISTSDKLLYWQASSSTLRAVTANAFSNISLAATVQQNIYQASHGFSIGNWLYYNGTSYALAQANAFGTTTVVGVVSAVIDANNFSLVLAGYVSDLSGLSPGYTYYLSDVTAGGMIPGYPSTGNSYIKPIFLALSATSGIVQIQWYPLGPPVGTIIDFAGATSPDGYLLCNGQAVSRTTYGNLYSVVGTTWGSGDGSTTFNVPNLARYVTIGSGGTKVSTQGPATTLGSLGGEEVHTMTTAELVSHSHAFPAYATAGAGTTAAQSSSGTFVNVTTTANGSTTPFNVMQLSAVVNKLIKF